VLLFTHIFSPSLADHFDPSLAMSSSFVFGVSRPPAARLISAGHSIALIAGVMQ
jgi:hypothetical protein